MYQYLFRCRTPTEDAVPYCGGCNQSRKSWMPERPVPRYRSRRQLNEIRDRLQQHRSSSDETDGSCPSGGACATIGVGGSSDSGIGSQELDMVDETLPDEAKNPCCSEEPTYAGEETSCYSNAATALKNGVSVAMPTMVATSVLKDLQSQLEKKLQLPV